MVGEACDFEMSWDDFADTMRSAQWPTMPMWVLDETQSLSLQTIRDIVQHTGPIPLFALLVRTSKMSATDPRDKVFAILGISVGIGSEIQLDYNMTFEQLYMDLARRLLCPAGDGSYLDILNVPRLPEKALQSSSGAAAASSILPSWVPNWYDTIDTAQWSLFPSVFAWVPLKPTRSSPCFHFYRDYVGATQAVCDEDEAYPGIDGPLLRLRGLRVSQITTVGLLHELFQRASGLMAKLQAVDVEVAAWRSDAHLCNIQSWFGKPYPHTSESMRGVWWQTMCAGQNMVDYAETKSGFENWFTHAYNPLRFILAPSYRP